MLCFPKHYACKLDPHILFSENEENTALQAFNLLNIMIIISILATFVNIIF